MIKLPAFVATAEHRMLEVLDAKVKLEDVKPGKNFQFAGDRDGVRHVIAVEDVYVLIKTLGHSNESGNTYAVHYTQLRPNQSRVWDDDNKLRSI